MVDLDLYNRLLFYLRNLSTEMEDKKSQDEIAILQHSLATNDTSNSSTSYSKGTFK